MNQTNTNLLNQIEASLRGGQNRANKRKFRVLFTRLMKTKGLLVNQSTHPITYQAVKVYVEKIEALKTPGASVQ